MYMDVASGTTFALYSTVWYMFCAHFDYVPLVQSICRYCAVQVRQAIATLSVLC
jgi:hypothetical protein